MSCEGEESVPVRTVVISDELWTDLGFAPSLLRRASVRLLSVRTGAEALSLAGASAPSLLLLDYDLPVLRGDEVCRRVRTQWPLKKVPVVIVGPTEPPQIQKACQKAGCDLFSPSPLDAPTLLPELGRLLGLPTRQGRRAEVVLSVSYGTVTTETLGESRDLSEGGIRVRCHRPVREGFYINLKFYLPGDKEGIVAPGHICRVVQVEEGEFDIGVRFLTLPKTALDRISGFLASLAEAQGCQVI